MNKTGATLLPSKPSMLVASIFEGSKNGNGSEILSNIGVLLLRNRWPW